MDGFTLQTFAFPVAPSNLDGFTLQGFQWFDIEAAAPDVGGTLCYTVTIGPRFLSTVTIGPRLLASVSIGEC